MNKILEDAKLISTFIKEDRRIIHKNPEVGFDLPDTVRFVKKRLDEMGIDNKICGGPISKEVREKFLSAGFPDMEFCYGVVAVIGEGSPCILLRADMDALPMPENADLEFKSCVPGKAHMCGHDAHTAMLLGAARLLKDREKELKGTVKLMFQPGEECGCGSKFMVDDGVLENPKVDAAFMIHVMSNLETGKAEYSTGVMSAAMDTFMVDIKGKGGHSSEPQKAIDPLLISNQLYTALNVLTGRECDPRETVALTVGVQQGGSAINVIPDESRIAFSMRSFHIDTRNHMLNRIPEIVDHTVKMWRGEYSMTEFHTPSTYVEPELCTELKPSIEKILGAGNIREVRPFSGTEDFAYVAEKVPSMAMWLGAGDPSGAPLHNPNMVLDEEAFELGAAIHTQVAVDWLESNSK